MCGVCALRRWTRSRPEGKLFDISAASFIKHMRKDGMELGLLDAAKLGSHAWRRGMAQDIIKAGGSLATLLRAGQWRSGAFRVYLQEQALDEEAVARLVIDHSDDEG